MREMNNLKIQITKSWRKSLSMRFDREGVLQVKAPHFCSKKQIDAFLEKNAQWIEREYTKIEERQKEKKWYLFGDSFPLGALTLSLSQRERGEKMQPHLLPLGEELGGGLMGGVKKQKIEHFYKLQAKKYIIPRCEELAEKYGFTYEKIRITSAMTRWGSCSSKKNLSFSYRLIMSPKECIDYVIIHELCHLRQMNHSKKFWSEVEKIMPEYKVHEKHLKEFGWRYVV